MASDNEPQGLQYNFDVGDVVESDEAWWRARGKAADDAAVQLGKLIRQVDPLFSRNYWGECVEGRATHTMFRGIIDTWVADLREQAASARNLSEACYEAARTLAAADTDAADTIF